MYFVKVDIKGCFDNMNQDRLLKILKDIFSVDQRQRYLLYTYATLKGRKGSDNILQTVKRKALPGGIDTLILDETLTNLAQDSP